MRRLILLCCLHVLLCADLATAKVASVPIEELIASSDAIVIATVSELIPDSNASSERVYARGLVQRTLKGSLAGSFRFVASPGWICDISGAVKDEIALFFLVRGGDGTFIIKHAGRGRMPFRIVGGGTYVTLWNDVRLPNGARTIAGPDPKYPFIVSVELAYVEALIQKHEAEVPQAERRR